MNDPCRRYWRAVLLDTLCRLPPAERIAALTRQAGGATPLASALPIPAIEFHVIGDDAILVGCNDAARAFTPTISDKLGTPLSSFWEGRAELDMARYVMRTHEPLTQRGWYQLVPTGAYVYAWILYWFIEPDTLQVCLHVPVTRCWRLATQPAREKVRVIG